MKHRKVIFFLIIAGGVLLRLYQIDSEFHEDELQTVERASAASFYRLLEGTIFQDITPPIYLGLLYLWIKIFGNSEVAVRMLSVLMSFVFLLVLSRMALQWMQDWSALFVVLLCSISPFLVYYGQWARPYSLICFLTVFSVYVLFKCLDDPPNKTLKVLYGLSCFALVYTQFLGVLILLPQFAALAFSAKRENRAVLLYGLAGMLSVLPLVLLIGAKLLPTTMEPRVRYLETPSVLGFVGFYAQLFGRLPKANTLLFALLTILVTSALILKYRDIDRKETLLILSLAFFGPLTVFLVSRLAEVSIWAPRHMIGSGVFFMCLIGYGIALHRRWMGIMLASMLVVWCFFSLPSEFRRRATPPWRFITSLLERKCPDCDVVITGHADLLRKYYSHKNIHKSGDYKSRLGTAERLAFLCRPTECEELKHVNSRYRILEVQVIKREGTGTQLDYKTVLVHFLQRSWAHRY